MPSVIIVGGGLSGLTLAYYLRRADVDVTIIEASDRLGGRVHTIYGKNNTPLELGATWFSDMHPELIGLLKDLGLQRYPQFSGGISLFQTKSFENAQQFYIPEAEQPSYRIAGGTKALIDALKKQISGFQVVLNHTVLGIREEGNHLVVTSSSAEFQGEHVVLCLPPQLTSTITYTPELPEALSQLLPTVQTWMAGAIKFVVEYGEPFWRNNGYSGMLYSHAGLIVEMYDHTNFDKNKFAFTGFLSGSAAIYSPEVRQELVLKQLSGLFGDQALNITAYHDKLWTDRFITSGNQLVAHPHQNNGHPDLSKAYLNGKLHFCGTETSTSHPGYMEGAIVSAKNKMQDLNL